MVWNFRELRFEVFSPWLCGSRLSNSICLTFSILGFMVPDCLEFPIRNLDFHEVVMLAFRIN